MKIRIKEVVEDGNDPVFYPEYRLFGIWVKFVHRLSSECGFHSFRTLHDAECWITDYLNKSRMNYTVYHEYKYEN